MQIMHKLLQTVRVEKVDETDSFLQFSCFLPEYGCVVPELWLILVIGVRTNIHEILAIKILILLLQTLISPKQ